MPAGAQGVASERNLSENLLLSLRLRQLPANLADIALARGNVLIDLGLLGLCVLPRRPSLIVDHGVFGSMLVANSSEIGGCLRVSFLFAPSQGVALALACGRDAHLALCHLRL